MTETTDSVVLPARAEDEALRADARRIGARTRILIADDHTIMREARTRWIGSRRPG